MNDQQLEAAGSGGGRQRCRREFRTRVSTVWYILLLCLLFKWKSHPDVGMYWRKKRKEATVNLKIMVSIFLPFLPLTCLSLSGTQMDLGQQFTSRAAFPATAVTLLALLFTSPQSRFIAFSCFLLTDGFAHSFVIHLQPRELSTQSEQIKKKFLSGCLCDAASATEFLFCLFFPPCESTGSWGKEVLCSFESSKVWMFTHGAAFPPAKKMNKCATILKSESGGKNKGHIGKRNRSKKKLCFTVYLTLKWPTANPTRNRRVKKGPIISQLYHFSLQALCLYMIIDFIYINTLLNHISFCSLMHTLSFLTDCDTRQSTLVDTGNISNKYFFYLGK